MREWLTVCRAIEGLDFKAGRCEQMGIEDERGDKDKLEAEGDAMQI